MKLFQNPLIDILVFSTIQQPIPSIEEILNKAETEQANNSPIQQQSMGGGVELF